MSTPTSKGKMDEVMKSASPREVLRFAKQVRKSYVQMVNGTEVPLRPAELREVDTLIGEVEALLN